jgi:hypothetical protein
MTCVLRLHRLDRSKRSTCRPTQQAQSHANHTHNVQSTCQRRVCNSVPSPRSFRRSGTGGTRARALAITSHQSAVRNATPSYEMAKGRSEKVPTSPPQGPLGFVNRWTARGRLGRGCGNMSLRPTAALACPSGRSSFAAGAAAAEGTGLTAGRRCRWSCCMAQP